MAFLQTTAASISSGGTINGDITIEGDLTVNGDGSGNYDEIVNGNIVISSGNSLGVGTDNPSTEVHVVSTGTAQVRIQSADASSDTRIEFYQSTTAKGFAGLMTQLIQWQWFMIPVWILLKVSILIRVVMSF